MYIKIPDYVPIAVRNPPHNYPKPCKYSDEVRARLSLFRKGVPRTEETKARISAAKKAKQLKLSDETKAKISKGNKGKVRTQDLKDRMSAIKKKWHAENPGVHKSYFTKKKSLKLDVEKATTNKEVSGV